MALGKKRIVAQKSNSKHHRRDAEGGGLGLELELVHYKRGFGRKRILISSGDEICDSIFTSPVGKISSKKLCDRTSATSGQSQELEDLPLDILPSPLQICSRRTTSTDPCLLHQTTAYDRHSVLHVAAASGQIEVCLVSSGIAPESHRFFARFLMFPFVADLVFAFGTIYESGFIESSQADSVDVSCDVRRISRVKKLAEVGANALDDSLGRKEELVAYIEKKKKKKLFNYW